MELSEHNCLLRQDLKYFPHELGYPFRLIDAYFLELLKNARKSIIKKVTKFITAGIDKNLNHLLYFMY